MDQPQSTTKLEWRGNEAQMSALLAKADERWMWRFAGLLLELESPLPMHEQIARIVGCSPRTVQNVFSGQSQFGMKAVYAIQDRLPLPLFDMWLDVHRGKRR